MGTAKQSQRAPRAVFVEGVDRFGVTRRLRLGHDGQLHGSMTFKGEVLPFTLPRDALREEVLAAPSDSAPQSRPEGAE